VTKLRATSPRASTAVASSHGNLVEASGNSWSAPRLRLRRATCSVNRRDGHETRAKRQRVSLFRRGFWKCSLGVHVLGGGQSCAMPPHAQAELALGRRATRAPTLSVLETVAAGPVCMRVVAAVWGRRAAPPGRSSRGGGCGHEQSRDCSADQRPIERRNRQRAVAVAATATVAAGRGGAICRGVFGRRA
jgi:hypothetical protein